MRIAGAAGGIGAILALNTVRIGTLGRAAASPAWFEALHVYGWPALLTLAIAGYVFTWMRFADRRCAAPAASAFRPRTEGTEVLSRDEASANPASDRLSGPLTRRFVLLTAVLFVPFIAASPLYLESGAVLVVAAFIARAAALGLRLFGIPAVATANVLSTARGGFLVTQECISTPLIPVYLAAVFASSNQWRWRAFGVVAMVPLFVGLGIARLLVVALPAALIGSPLFLIHAFYQLLLAMAVVLGAAFWRHGAGPTAWRRALLGGTVGGLLAYLMAPTYTSVVMTAFTAGTPLDDPQGAIAFLPAFQLGLYRRAVGGGFRGSRWRRFVAGLALLGVSQTRSIRRAAPAASPRRTHAARARRPRLGARRSVARRARDGDLWPAASLKSRSSRRWPSILTLVIAAPVLRAPSDGSSAWRSSDAITTRSP